MQAVDKRQLLVVEVLDQVLDDLALLFWLSNWLALVVERVLTGGQNFHDVLFHDIVVLWSVVLEVDLQHHQGYLANAQGALGYRGAQESKRSVIEVIDNADIQ